MGGRRARKVEKGRGRVGKRVARSRREVRFENISVANVESVARWVSSAVVDGSVQRDVS